MAGVMFMGFAISWLVPCGFGILDLLCIYSHLIGYNISDRSLTLYPLGCKMCIDFYKGGYRTVNKIAEFIKENRKAARLTQEEFAARSGLGLRFIRELEQGKETVRMDKVNAALAMFDMEAVPGRKDDK